MNIQWNDGKDSTDKFVLEIFFENCKGYLKGDYVNIGNYYDVLWKCDEVVGMTIYDPKWKVVATKYRASILAAAS